MTTDMRSANNSICQTFQLAMKDYEAHAHPVKHDHEVLLGRAKECLLGLDSTAMSDPESYVQAAILYDNCKEIVEAVHDAPWHIKNDEGNWVKEYLPRFEDIELPGQSESWDDKYDAACEKIRQEFFDQSPEHVRQAEELKAAEAELDAQLDELKKEKKAQGFFNFSGKREVKDRMEPLKEQRKGIQRQLDALDDVVDDYVEQRIDERAEGFVRLSF